MILYDSLYSVLVHIDLTETQILLDRKPKLVDSAAMFISTLCKPMSGVYVFKCLTIEEVDLVLLLALAFNVWCDSGDFRMLL